MRVTPNHLRLGEDATELHEKTFHSVASIVRPVGNYTATIQITVDGRVQNDTVSLVTGSGDLIGTTFVIGTSLIGSTGGTTIVPTPVGDRGRAIQVEWSKAGVNEDLELYGYAVLYTAAELMSLETT